MSGTDDPAAEARLAATAMLVAAIPGAAGLGLPEAAAFALALALVGPWAHRHRWAWVPLAGLLAWGVPTLPVLAVPAAGLLAGPDPRVRGAAWVGLMLVAAGIPRTVPVATLALLGAGLALAVGARRGKP